MHQVRAESVVLACYNALIPQLLPELPAEQKDALAYSVKVPMLYTNVLLRRWTSFKQLGVASINAPGMYHPNTSLDPGSTVGGYQGVTTPDEPIVVHMVRNPNKPGLPRKEQNRLGQQELLTMSLPRLRAVDPPAVRPDARRHRLRSRRRHRRHGREPLARRLLLHLRHAGRSRRRRPSSGRTSSAGGASAR